MSAAVPTERPARRLLMGACEALAVAGGIALLGTMATMMITVVGAPFNKPLLGDSELVELLGGIAVFLFLPYCHLRGGNVIVDFFTQPLPQRAKDWLDALMNLVFTCVAIVLMWRLIEGWIAAVERDKRSMFLQLPDAWGYALGTFGMALWIVVCAYVAWEKFERARLGSKAQ